MEPWRAVDTHNGGVDTQYGDLEGFRPDSHHFDEKQDPGPH
jgi:hypothetical protein